MEASELRIGNSIAINGDIVERIGYASIMDFAQKKKGVKNYYLDSLIFKAIPLTEEWLLKFGFEKYGFSYYLNSKIYKFHFQSIKGDYLVNTEFSTIKNGGNPSIKEDYHVLSYNIKHVHELQNIYFALTNKELTIKQ